MRINQKGLALIKHFEGFSKTPYLCAAGYWTIGYGHVIHKKTHPAITKEQAELLLIDDIKEAEDDVLRLINASLHENAFAALVSFTFNLGGGRLQSSSLRRKLNSGDVLGAASEFPKWVFGGGQKLQGLVLRRNAEKNLFMLAD